MAHACMRADALMIMQVPMHTCVDIFIHALYCAHIELSGVNSCKHVCYHRLHNCTLPCCCIDAHCVGSMSISVLVTDWAQAFASLTYTCVGLHHRTDVLFR